MKNSNGVKKNFLSFLIIICVIIIGFFALSTSSKKDIPETDKKAIKKITIVACPTCYEMAKKLNSEKYQIIPTASTAESVELVKSRQADLMLAGRTLKPHEPPMEEIIIEDGYSFIGDEEIFIYASDLKNYPIYTDLDIELIKNNFSVAKIEKVDDVYQYLDKGIAITSWDNTDYARAKIIHLLENNNERVKLSRRPTIYCPAVCPKDAQELALLLK